MIKPDPDIPLMVLPYAIKAFGIPSLVMNGYFCDDLVICAKPVNLGTGNDP
ncbi:hypothetical protein D3C71_1784930 [compost metagenome]